VQQGMLTDDYFMREALKEAQDAFDKNEVPVGALIVCNGTIIARAHNLVETLNDVTAHAEIMCYTAAAEYLGSKYITDCVMYVTLEPCAMCAGALYWSRLGRLVYGAKDEKKGYTLLNGNLLHPSTKVSSGVLQFESAALLKEFFKKKRK